MEDEQITVFPGAHLNLGAIARKEASVVIDPKLDSGVVGRGRGSRGHSVGPGASESEGEE
jgi:hypothetical protein